MNSKPLKRILINPLFTFNLINRDRWVRAQAARLPAGSRVLDVGAGSCPYRVLFAHCDYRTQDFKPLNGEQLRHGKYGQIDYVGDATAIPAPDAEFDAILCTEVLEHLPEPIRVIHEMARLLKPGGIVLITAPLGSGIHQEPYHFYGGFTPFWYQRFLSAAGFESIEVEANAGFFRFFGQEAIRFLHLSAPWRIQANLLTRLFWFPFWLFMVPFLGLFMPALGMLIDSWDREQHFTVGYSVRARRAGEVR